MIVVADTSPLNYLILIDHIDVLEILYGRIAIPAAVKEEMISLKAPTSVREWALSPPAWLEVHESVSLQVLLSDQLDAGEREAIGLALALKASVLIIDEAVGRREAQRVGLRVIGTLGILRNAHEEGLLDFKSAIERLQTTSFHVSARLSLNSCVKADVLVGILLRTRVG